MASVQLMPLPTTGEAMAIDMASVQVMLRLPLTMAAGAMAAMDMARGLLMLRHPHTTAGEAMAAPNPPPVPSRRSAKLHRLKHTPRLQWQDPHKWPRLILSLPTNTRLLQHRTPRHKLQAILQVTRKP